MTKYIKAVLTIKIPWDSLTDEERAEAPEAFKQMKAELSDEASELGRKGVITGLEITEVEE